MEEIMGGGWLSCDEITKKGETMKKHEKVYIFRKSYKKIVKL